MSSDSFQLLGMAERGFLPACLARRSRYETPTLAIVLSSVGICALSMFDFRQVTSSHPSWAVAPPGLYTCQAIYHGFAISRRGIMLGERAICLSMQLVDINF